MKRRLPHLYGLTLTEVIIVLVVISLLTAITIPIVQISRESQRSTECRNNLKQLGLACHNYHDIWKSLPPMRCGTTTSEGFSDPQSNEVSMSGLVSITPYIECQSVYDQAWNQNFGPVPWHSAPHWDFQFASMLCPSDRHTINGRGNSSYKFVLGNKLTGNNGSKGIAMNGLFGSFGYDPSNPSKSLGETYDLESCWDGLSNTLMLSERRNAAGSPRNDIAWVATNVSIKASDPSNDENRVSILLDAYNACWATADDSDGQQYHEAQAVHPTNPGSRWCDGRPFYAGITTHIPPNGPSCTTGDGDWFDGVWTASSRHPRMVNGILGDASTRPFRNNVDLKAWWAVGTRNGSDDYSKVIHY